MARQYPLAGKVAVIVGGSGGIGAATARLLAEEGASVVVTYRSDATGAAKLVQTLAGSGHRAEPVTVEDTGTITALASLVGEVYGRADILVNTAGFTKAVPIHDLDALDDALIDRLFQVNWRGQFATIRAFRSLLERSGDGLVVNVSSIAALSGVGSNIAYAAVKPASTP